jgi:hypothetical protein
MIREEAEARGKSKPPFVDTALVDIISRSARDFDKKICYRIAKQRRSPDDNGFLVISWTGD